MVHLIRWTTVPTNAAEALETYRHNAIVSFAEELADIAIRLLDLASGLGIDLGAEIVTKLEKNRKRAHRHGGKTL
jgi:NTP pyrophosphatase (non-canonical NTP hydrolase)